MRPGIPDEPGGLPPWYVFVLLALGMVLVAVALFGVGPRTNPPVTPSEPTPHVVAKGS